MSLSEDLSCWPLPPLGSSWAVSVSPPITGRQALWCLAHSGWLDFSFLDGRRHKILPSSLGSPLSWGPALAHKARAATGPWWAAGLVLTERSQLLFRLGLPFLRAVSYRSYHNFNIANIHPEHLFSWSPSVLFFPLLSSPLSPLHIGSYSPSITHLL